MFHIRKDSSPMLLITGDREYELLGRYEETAYFWRMMQEVGHSRTNIFEMQGADHNNMVEPALPIMLDFIDQLSP